jgi:hypothetical protein
VECNLVWNQTRDYKIARPRSGSSICNHKFDFTPKLHDTKCNYYFIIIILKSYSLDRTTIILQMREYISLLINSWTGNRIYITYVMWLSVIWRILNSFQQFWTRDKLQRSVRSCFNVIFQAILHSKVQSSSSDSITKARRFFRGGGESWGLPK